MRTKKQIMHSLFKEQGAKMRTNREEFTAEKTERIKEAMDSGDIIAILSANLTSAIVEVVEEPNYNNLSFEQKRAAMFQTIFLSVDTMKEAEKIFAEQFHVEEEIK